MARMTAQCGGAKADDLLVFQTGVPGATHDPPDIPMPCRAATRGMVFAPVFLATARTDRQTKRSISVSGSVERLQAIEAVTNYSPISEPLNFSKVQIGEFFASNVFSRAVMKQRLPRPVYQSLSRTIDGGTELEPPV